MCASLERRSHDLREGRAHRCEQMKPRGEGRGVSSLEDDRGDDGAGGSDYIFESGVQCSASPVCAPGSVALGCILPVRSDSCNLQPLAAKVAMTQPAIRRAPFGPSCTDRRYSRVLSGVCVWQFGDVGRQEVEPPVEGGAFAFHRLLAPTTTTTCIHMYSAKQMHTDIPRLVASRLKYAETQNSKCNHTNPYPYHPIVVAERVSKSV